MRPQRAAAVRTNGAIAASVAYDKKITRLGGVRRRT